MKRCLSSPLFPVVVLALSCNLLQSQVRCPIPEQLRGERESAAHFGQVGDWFVQQGKNSCAVEAFRKSSGLNPDSAVLHASLGQALYASGEVNKGLQELERAIVLDPGFVRAYLALGVMEHDLGHRDRALRNWQLAIRLDPGATVALDWIAKTRLEAGQYTAAIDLLRSAELTEDLAVDLLLAEDKAGLHEDAIALGNDSLRKHSDWDRLRIAVTVLLVQRNRLEEAVVSLRQSLENQPRSMDVQLLYLRVLLLQNDVQTAVPYALTLLQTHPDDFETLYLNGLLERLQGNYTIALEHLLQAATLQPAHYDVQFNLGSTLAKLHRLPEARTTLERAAALPEAAPEVHFQLASVLRAMGDGAGAAVESATYQQKLHVRAEHDRLVSLSAQAWRKLSDGDAVGAADVERVILRDFPDEAVHWYDLAIALDRLDDLEGERTALERAIQLKPGFSTAWNQLGYLKMKSGRADEAASAFQSAITSAPQYAEAENNLGSLLAQEGRDGEAEGHFRAALDANPRYTGAWINLAAILAASERFSDARTAVESALRLEPKNPEAAELLGLLPSAASGKVSP